MQLCCLVVPSAAWTAGAACLLHRKTDGACSCRAHVVAAVPSLRQLDGRAVTSEERHQAAMALRHEETVMALMLSNACLVHKLVGSERGLPHAQAFERQAQQLLYIACCVSWQVLAADILGSRARGTSTLNVQSAMCAFSGAGAVQCPDFRSPPCTV